jgi:methylenetetrahydrofolate--tRNA-(uracil-5-)-methyltransferase
MPRRSPVRNRPHEWRSKNGERAPDRKAAPPKRLRETTAALPGRRPGGTIAPMTSSMTHVIGGGLAGSEAAWRLAQDGLAVTLHEMRPVRATDAHHTDSLAELVCSNSFRSDDADANAVGLLHQEMRRLGSLVMQAADRNQVPAGGALAVDRVAFAADVTAALESHPLVTIVREEVDGAPPADWEQVVVATGPLTSPGLAEAIRGVTGEGELAFFDAIAPIVHRDSIDMSVAWMQSRYDKVGPGGTGADYINCPMTREQYETFVAGLVAGDKVSFKEWEATTPYFDGCLPVEVMAERGPETLRHGPMKPMGLTNAHQPEIKAYAVVQLRQDNALGTLYNMVGFQTKLRHAEQVRLFRTIPGLENAEFARLGGLHRNTYLNGPRLLDGELRLKAEPRLRFAGQITGCEGYVESAAIGLMAGLFASAERRGLAVVPPPQTTALGALLAHVTGGHLTVEGEGPKSYQPMNVNFGLFPPIGDPIRTAEGGRVRGAAKAAAKKRMITDRARLALADWLGETPPVSAAAE